MDAPTPPSPVRYCVYARKSTEQDERQALSIDSQVKEMLELASREGLDVAEIRRESHSAKASGCRPVYNGLIEDIRMGKFSGILTWAPDRLSRNAGDLGSLVDLMDQGLLAEIRAYGQRFTNSPSEKFLLMILCSQAKLENDNKSLNVKRGLKAKVELGLWPEVAPTGYLNERRTDRKGYLLVDPERGPIVRQLFEKAANEQQSGRQLHRWLKQDIRFTSRSGKPLSLSNVYRILGNSFYAGTFEYPRGSGKWYTGKHQPLISKELYQRVQEQMKTERVFKYASKEFAFTRLMTCGRCGSGICAQEKFKELKDGTVAKYVYYGCTRARDLSCKGGYLREEELVSQLLGLIAQLNVDELGIRKKLELEVERHNHFHSKILELGAAKDEAPKDLDIKKYAAYLLREGTVAEKRELLACLKTRLVMRDKILTLKAATPL